MTPTTEAIREAFDEAWPKDRAELLREVNADIEQTRDKLDHLLRRRAELLGNIEDVFNESPVQEQPGLDKLLKAEATMAPMRLESIDKKVA